MTDLTQRDLQHIWHPCSQMKDYESFKPLPVRSARGSYIELTDGTQIIDAISSWWCKSLGHAHPRLQQALLNQMECFEHVILANTTNETIVKLSERLATLTPTLDKVLFSGDGSCAVECAMKLSLHARTILGETDRQQFIALENAYHGETVGALSVSDLGIYRDPYQNMLFRSNTITHIPTVSGTNDPLWKDCSAQWPAILKQLEPLADSATALILEPILQGAGGMRIHSADFLRRLREWTQANNIHLIADEIMTGFGRTGTPLACDHAGIEPDFLCLAKGLTAGMLPLSVTLTSARIYDLFYADYGQGRDFLHSHTHSGNTLAAAVACAVFDVMEEEKTYAQVEPLGAHLRESLMQIAEETGRLENVRQIGAVAAADLCGGDLPARAGYQIYREAVQQGALLRPLGNTLYWLPPLNTDRETVEKLANITTRAIQTVL